MCATVHPCKFDLFGWGLPRNDLPCVFKHLQHVWRKEMVLDLAISLISSIPSPLLHGFATIFLFPIFSSIGLQIHPQLEMGRTWGTPVRGHTASAWW